jgi:hypothetical protein
MWIHACSQWSKDEDCSTWMVTGAELPPESPLRMTLPVGLGHGSTAIGRPAATCGHATASVDACLAGMSLSYQWSLWDASKATSVVRVGATEAGRPDLSCVQQRCRQSIARRRDKQRRRPAMRPLHAKPLRAACIAHQCRHIAELVPQCNLQSQVANVTSGFQGAPA